jgi:hypothetical protein
MIRRHRSFAALLVGIAATCALSGCAPVPKSVIVMATGDGSATLTLDSGSQLTETFEVMATPGNVEVTDHNNPITINGLTNGVTYTFTVRALSINNVWSAWSDPTAPVTPSIAPSAPTINSFSGVVSMTDCTGHLAFTPPTSDGGAAITGYTVTIAGSPSTTVQVGTTSPISLPGLVAHQSYTLTLQAVNSNGPSAPSSALTADCT